MTRASLSRREIVRTMAAASVGASLSPVAAAARQVKWSGGTERPKIPLPPGAVDCHHHIYDARYPADPKASLRPADALISDYRDLQARVGIARHVIVQPSTYGTDNRLVLESLKEFGASARGIVVVKDDIANADLKSMHDLGVRGVRFNLSYPAGAPVEMMQPLAGRTAAWGWHVQVVAGAERIVTYADLLRNLPVPVVFDHMGQLPSVSHPAFSVIAKLLEQSKAWVKLSGAYTFSKVGPPTYSDAAEIAKGFLKLAPERLVWGTDWPHPTAAENAKPDDALLVDLTSDWIGSDALRKRIFVENPTNLYGF
ncbi:amidohydrolase family protein [Bradyrhizobium sp. UFLA05-112]